MVKSKDNDIYQVVRRLFVILERLMSPFGTTLKELKELIKENDFNISERTLQRDIQSLREQFSIEIKYDREKNIYYIDRYFRDEAKKTLKMLYLFNNANTIFKSSNDLSFMSMEVNPSGREIINLEKCIIALKRHLGIKIRYWNDEREYEIEPYLLQEFKSCWYLVANDIRDKKLKIFGLDRINSIKLGETFIPKTNNMKIRGYFYNIIGRYKGINRLKNNYVEIKVDNSFAEYLRVFPLHRFQKESKIDEKTILIKFKTIVDEELYRKILGFSQYITVLKPEELALEIKNSHQRILGTYEELFANKT